MSETVEPAKRPDKPGPAASTEPIQDPVYYSYESGRRRWIAIALVAGVMAILAFVGLGLSNFAPDEAEWFWAFLLPVFGLIASCVGWQSRQPTGTLDWRAIRQQIFHWLGLVIAVYLIFLLVHAERIQGDAAGLASLIVVALTTYLAGVHVDGRFVWLALILAVGVIFATYMEEYFWILFVVTIGGIASVSFIWWWQRKRRA